MARLFVKYEVHLAHRQPALPPGLKFRMHGLDPLRLVHDPREFVRIETSIYARACPVSNDERLSLSTLSL